MKTQYKTFRIFILIFIIQNMGFQMHAQTFVKVYPTSIPQSTKDILPADDGGFFIVGMTTNAIPGDSDIYLVKTNSTGDIMWTKTFGGNKPDYPNTILKASDGNYFISGFTRSFGSGQSDIWLLKVDTSGNTIWSKTFGTASNDEGKEIISTSDGNYVLTGNYNGDAFLMKLDISGNVKWQQQYGGPLYESCNGVKECSDGGFIMIGHTLSFGNGGSDIYMVKTDALGNKLWSKTFGGTLDDEGRTIVANSDGTFTFSSSDSTASDDWDVHVRKTDMSGGLIWDKTYGGNKKDVSKSFQATSDGGYIIGATSRSFSWINPEMWLVKIDVNGNTLWTRHYGNIWHDHSYMVKQYSDGGYIAVGHSTDSTYVLTQMMFVKTDPSGLAGVPQFASVDSLFRVYPNPSDGLFKITFSDNVTSSAMSIYNSAGQKIISENIRPINQPQTIDLRGIATGIYFLNMKLNNQLSTKEIIVENK